jgi:ferredoxin
MGGAGVTVLPGCPVESDGDETSYNVVLPDQDERAEVEIAEREEPLYPALDAGVDIPYAWQAGRYGKWTGKYDDNAITK